MISDDRVSQVDDLRKSGMGVKEAAKKAGISVGTYYERKKKFGSKKRKKPTKPGVLEFAVPSSSSAKKVALLITNTADLLDVMGALWP